MRSVCVYCGSGDGLDPAFTDAAVGFGQALAQRSLSLIYGGARNGLMGAVADAALAGGASVTGVIPQALVQWEQAHPGLSQQLVVGSMRERKQRMADGADAFVALPGGIGTLEEIVEMISWAQLGVHFKPCAFLNVNGYYDKLFEFLDHSVDQGLMRPKIRQMILVDNDPSRLLDALARYRSPVEHRWLDLSQS